MTDTTNHQHPKVVQLLLLSPTFTESDLHTSPVDPGLTHEEEITETLECYRSSLWSQGWDPDAKFKEKSDWHVFRVISAENLDYQGKMADLVTIPEQ